MLFQHFGRAANAAFATGYIIYLWRMAKHLGVNFGASKPGQTLSGFFWFIEERPRLFWQNFLGRFEGSNKGPSSASNDIP